MENETITAAANTDETIAINNQAINENVIAIETSDENNNLSADDDVGTFTDLKNAIDDGIDSGVVNLDKDYKYSSRDVSYKEGISLSVDGLTINGNNHIIDGDNKAVIFHIYGSNIILKDIIFANGLAKGTKSALGGQSGVSDGGAIYIDDDASASIINSTFSNNVADRYGGAIYGAGWAESLEVTDSTFTSNSVSYSGGAIYWGNTFGEITISNSKFDSNGASNGAALWIQTNNAEITDSSFTNNVGGSIKSPISIRGADNLKLSNNDIDEDGIYFLSGNIISETNLLLSTENNDDEVLLTATLVDDNNNVIIIDEDELKFNLKFILSNSQTIDATDYSDGVWSATVTDDDVTLISVEEKPFDETNIINSDIEIEIPDGSFTELQNLINDADNEITLDRNYVYDPVLDRGLNEGIIINKDNFVINGNNHILDAINQVRILYLNATNVVLNDIVFVNANQKTGSRDSENLGGAIYITAHNTKILNSTFINNTAGYGAAIYSYYADGHQIINSTFINNTAKSYGGSIYLRASYDVQIINNSYIGNKANSNDGGAISTSTANNLRIINSKFINNTASGKGGSIFVSGSNVKILDSNFTNNSAGAAGAVYTDAEDSEIANSNFINNSASTGGSVSIVGINVLLHNSTFINSSASSSGGAVNIDSAATNAKLYNLTFVNSVASNSRGTSGTGGAINVGAPNVEISNSTFINSRAGNNGGVIAASSSPVRNFVVDNIIVINSSVSSGKGGSIYYTGNVGGKILNSLFINSSSPDNGGVIYWLGTSSDNPSIINSHFINSSAKSGGVAYISNKQALIKDSTFTNSTAETGGALYLGGADDQIINSTFENSSAINGGVIYATGSSGTSISDSTFKNNNATRGGVIYVTNSEALTIYTSKFINNNATSNGGAAYWEGNIVGIHDSIFIENYAGNNGGALYLNGNLFNDVSGNDFINNSAEVDGGAIYWYGSRNTNNDDGSLTNSNFINNTAVTGNGGAVYWDGGYFPDYTIATSTFTNNTAARNGGALYLLKYRQSVITESTFESNTALNGTGGAIYIDDSWGLEISESNFIKNNASSTGGAVYVIDTTHPSTKDILSFNSDIFEENTAYDGAAIFLWNITDAEIYNSEFTNNNASEGNVISLDVVRYALTVSDTIFNGDVSKVAVYSPKELKLNNNVLNDNTIIYLAKGGNITTETHIIVLNNGTYKTDLTYVLSARFTDDNNNTIVLDDSFNQLKFILNNEEVTAIQDENGNWTYEYVFEEYGEYNVSATLNDFKNSIIYNGTLKVEVILPSADVTVNVEDTDYGENASVKVTLNSSARGDIILYIGDELYKTVELSDVNNGNININITNLNAGDYTITVKYSGDDNYEYDSIDKIFTVNKIDPVIVINAPNITVGETAEVSASLPADAKGNLTITVNNTEYNVTDSELIIINNLTANTYEVTVSYAGDNNYNAFENKTQFQVNKKVSEITIDVEESILINNEATIIVSVTEGATGTVNININGTITSLNLSESNSISIPFNNPGEFTINATYLGDDTYANSTSENKILTVIDKITPTIKINADVQVYAEEEIIITIETDGYNPTVTINNEIQEVHDGKVTYVPEIQGVYLITVQTTENDTYYAGQESKVFTAIKDGLLNPTIEIIPVEDLYVGENVTIIVNTNSNSDINITVNGINVENNTVFKPETDGVYTIIVKTALSNRCNEGLAVSTFNVNKKPSQIDITVDETSKRINDELTIKINTTATNGIVLINVNDEKYVVNIEDNDELTIILPEVGEYIIDATYVGSDEYESSEAQENIIVVVEDKQLENTTIELNNNTIKIPENVTGNATVKVDGKTIYSGDVQNIPTLDDLTPGDHIIEIAYSGDENHNPTTNTTAITIPKEKTEINADDVEITEGETVNVKITINDEISGIVFVELNDKKYYGEITNGEATIEITNLTAGNYTASVNYNGDETYNSAINTVLIKVIAKPAVIEPQNTNITIEAPNIANTTTTPIVEIILPEDATGNISVYVDGDLVNTISANETLSIPLENLEPGAHLINVTYTGDEKYAPANEISAIAIIEEAESITPNDCCS